MRTITTIISLSLLITFFTSVTAYAQVGIGTTSPQSRLDIAASDPNAPIFTDGLLIPRVNNFSATHPGSAQDGMLVFLTQAYSTYDKGFHYWDNATTSWLPFTSSAAEWTRAINAKGNDVLYANQANENGYTVAFTKDGKFGIGTDDPVEGFEIKREGDNDIQLTSADTNPPNFVFYNTGGTLDAPGRLATNQEIGSVIFKTYDGTNTREVGGLRYYIDGTPTANSLPTKFVVSTVAANTTNQVERFTVKNDGNVGIGTATPQEKLHVAGSMRSDALATANNPTVTYPAAVVANADGTLQVQNSASSGRGLYRGVEIIDQNFYTNQNNMSLNLSTTDASIFILNDTGDNQPINITGISGGTDGRVITVKTSVRNANFRMYFHSENGGSQAQNRLSIWDGGGQIEINNKEAATFVYVAKYQRWHLLSTSDVN